MDNFELIFAGLAVLYYFFIELPRKARQKAARREAHKESIESKNNSTQRRQAPETVAKQKETTITAFEKSLASKRSTPSQPTAKVSETPDRHHEKPSSQINPYLQRWQKKSETFSQPSTQVQTPTQKDEQGSEPTPILEDMQRSEHASIQEEMQRSEHAETTSLHSLGDLPTAIIMNEVLNPPVSLR